MLFAPTSICFHAFSPATLLSTITILISNEIQWCLVQDLSWTTSSSDLNRVWTNEGLNFKPLIYSVVKQPIRSLVTRIFLSTFLCFVRTFLTWRNPCNQWPSRLGNCTANKRFAVQYWDSFSFTLRMEVCPYSYFRWCGYF